MSQPKLVLVGGNGFLGRHLAEHFQNLGYQVVSISRTGPDDTHWDARTLGPWAQALEGADLLTAEAVEATALELEEDLAGLPEEAPSGLSALAMAMSEDSLDDLTQRVEALERLMARRERVFNRMSELFAHGERARR